MDIIDLIDKGLVEPSRFSGEVIVSRRLFDKFCQQYSITDKSLARTYYSALLNYVKRVDYCDEPKKVMAHIERIMTELTTSTAVTEVTDVVEVFIGHGDSLDYRNAGFTGMRKDK